MPKLVQTKIIMINAADESKNLVYEREISFADYELNLDSTAFDDEFYPIVDLSKEGFIFPDGSLHFKFWVKKTDGAQ